MTKYTRNGEIEPTIIGGPPLDTDRETGETFVSVPIEPTIIGAPLTTHAPDPLPARVPQPSEEETTDA